MDTHTFLKFVAVLTLCITSRLVSTEVETKIMTVRFDDRAWTEVYNHTIPSDTIMEFVPFGESLSKHTELYTVMVYYDKFKNTSLHELFDHINTSYLNSKPDSVQLKVLEDKDNIHMATYAMPGMTPGEKEHTVFRLMKVNGNVYHISYMNKNSEDFQKKFKTFEDLILSYKGTHFKLD